MVCVTRKTERGTIMEKRLSQRIDDLSNSLGRINEECKKIVGLFVWIDRLSVNLKAKVTDITVLTFDDELVIAYLTERDFHTYIPYSKEFYCGSYLTTDSDKRHSISLWSMVGTEEDRQEHLDIIHRNREEKVKQVK